MSQMFCFQCEQTAGCTGCTGKAGVCGKSAETARLQDELTGELIALAKVGYAQEVTEEVPALLMEGLFMTITNVNFDNDAIRSMTNKVRRAIEKNVPDCAKCETPCGKISPYNMDELWQDDEDIRSLKSLILFGVRGIAAYAYHASALGYTDERVTRFLYKGLAAVGEYLEMEDLLPIVMETGEANLICMELLERANTQSYGIPAPAQVSMKVEKGPFIIVTGHDLKDLKMLLEQSEGKGVNIYTNGEMLPAHAYPELRKYSHLKGNFGTAWFRQREEFDAVPAPVLYTTNCLMPPKASYSDRIFATNAVGYPGMQVIGEEKDFTPVIEKALELGGYEEDREFTGINGGKTVATGFGSHTILSLADQIVEAVKAGDIRHFFLVGGCDGYRGERSYYTEFVKQAPEDTVILTLACGKYRFNDMDLGEINGIPRLLDMGQCNDAYGAVQVALALAEAFQCGVNDLPLTLVLSWYEQKAVCILLSLLHLGIKNIYLGPTLPAFLSENVLNYLVEHYDIHPVSTPQEDLKKILG